MRRMPPDGLCLYHAVNYAQNPELYEKVDMGTNAMPLGEGSGSLFQAAAALRGKLDGTDKSYPLFVGTVTGSASW